MEGPSHFQHLNTPAAPIGIVNDGTLQQQNEGLIKLMADSQEMAHVEIPKKEKKRNRDKKNSGLATAFSKGKDDSTASEKKDKKRKRKDVDNSNPAVHEMEADVEFRPEKRLKNRTRFADPRRDSSLGSQSQKGE